MDLITLKRTAAEIAAAAVFELFPDVELWGGGETPTGFSYDLYFPHPINPETVSMIEERMRQIVREKRAIRTLNMVAFSAKEFLKKKGHFARTEDLGDDEEVELIQMGDFVDLSPGPHLKNSAEAAAFKITSIDALPDQGVRIVGCVHTSKDALKYFLKKLAQYKSPEKMGEERGYWLQSPFGLVWKKSGLVVREKLIEVLKSHLFEGAVEVSSPLGSDLDEVHAWLKMGRVAEVKEGQIQINSYGSKGELQEKMISSLHSVAKTLTILGFTASMPPLGRVAEFWVEDGIERQWPIVQVKKDETRVAILVDVERIFALLLEIGKLENQ